MNRKFFMAILAVCMLGMIAVLRADSPKAEMVSYRSGDDTVSGYLALPEGAGKYPAIIVIHEWWGLNDWVEQQAQRFASQGYVALAVDLYRGKTGTTPDEAHILMRGLPDDRGLRDLEAAFAYLASRPDVEASKIGSIGWCMGGGWSIKLAEDQSKLAAFVVNYGSLPTDSAIIAKIKAPMLGNFGADDRGIPPESVHAFETAMKSAGKTADIKIYDGAGHAFQNPNNKAGYRPEAAADSDKRIDAFFAKNLR
ncbi:MAG TPA: dienelactone hydrolase family protein [Candidatus Limnocylindrales bacterium]|nr:dienelactone hydrolase family protein [Candidatus Limnocylindrales bacterium]